MSSFRYRRHGSGRRVVLDGVDEDERVNAREVCDQIESWRSQIRYRNALIETVAGVQHACDERPNTVVSQKHAADSANRDLHLRTFTFLA